MTPTKRQHRYHTRCWMNGMSCMRHSQNVLAGSPREALAKVVDASNFGPLHRQYPRGESQRLIAYVKVGGNADTMHGGIEVERGWYNPEYMASGSRTR